MEPIFKKIINIGILSGNIDRTIESFTFKYGIGPWSIYDCGPENIKDMNLWGKPVISRFKLADCRLGDTGFEIIQPLDGNNIYSEFIKKKGQYLHHIGYEIKDYEGALDFLNKEGFQASQSGNFYSEKRYIYFNSENSLKHIIKLVEAEKEYFKYHENANGISNLDKPSPTRIFPKKDEVSKMISPVFKKISQVSFIVNSVDDMVRKYNNELGIGPWKIWEFGPETVNDMTIGGKRADYRMRLALSKIGGIDIELIQPRDDKSIYADFLKTNGEGFHHLAYEADDFEMLMDHMEEIGVKVSMSGNWCGKHIWVYLTTVDDLNHIVELNSTEPGFIYPEPVDNYPER